MSDLLARLKAALDEDERVALAASGHALTNGTRVDHGPWRVDPEQWTQGSGVIDSHDESVVVAVNPPVADHVARWDPARVLRWVAAAREVLGRHRPPPGLLVRAPCEVCIRPMPCPDVRALAGVYGIGEG